MMAILLYLSGTARITPLDRYDDSVWYDDEDSIQVEDDEDVGVVTPSEGTSFDVGENCTCPKRFSSQEELELFVKQATTTYNDYYYVGGFAEMVGGSWSGTFTLASADFESLDYSTTNIQVEGVDEPDIVKTDGEHLYVVSNGEVAVLKAYPGEDAQILSRISVEHYVSEIFVSGSRLILFERPPLGGFNVHIFDISSRSSPAYVTNVSISGRLVDSRMIDEFVYVIASQGVKYYAMGEYTVRLPAISSGNSTYTVEPGDICFFDEPAPSFVYTTIVSISIDTEEVSYGVFLTDSAGEVYVSQKNVYLASLYYSYWFGDPENGRSEATTVHKISIQGDVIEYVARGEVPGRINDQFSMDEHEGYFRIASTEGYLGRMTSDSNNHVFVLNQNLVIVGRLENLAPGEKIYSSRFMGDRCYLVTFKKVDPFFVIDLSIATSPKVLGKLKIPGYSDYLHPYDENHIIGLGKETVEAEDGDFAWYQGVKLSLFDVTDVTNPVELSKYVIGDRGTTSEALSDHKTFMFSRANNLLIIPITLAKIDPDKYPDGIPPNARGDIVWTGACVFSLTLEGGFEPRGGISHSDDNSVGDYWVWSSYRVRRSLYIEEFIYTISESLVKINRMDDLSLVKTLAL
jgi:uncharacterized secreted protein with C-terminal beta-propeller domain